MVAPRHDKEELQMLSDEIIEIYEAVMVTSGKSDYEMT